jgi:rhodanese-related sulfurtransferase
MALRPLRIAWILASAVVISAFWNSLSGSGIDLTANAFVEPHDVVIDVAEAKRRHDRGAVFLDARPRAFWEMNRIPGALALPEDDFEASFPRLEPHLRTRFDIVVYCSGMGCEASHHVSRFLRDRGIASAILDDGLPAWEDAGHAVDERPAK